METGATSTASQETPAETSLREAIEGRANVRRLLHLASVDSIDRNLVSEDKAAWGSWDETEASEESDEEEDEMRILAARDVIMQAPESKPAEADTKSTTLAGKLLPLVASAALGSAIPLAAMYAGLFDGSPSADTNTRYTIEAMEGE